MKLYPIFIRPLGEAVGGRVYTQCFLITEEKKVVAFGQAFKRPEDNFDRKRGMRIALGRAVKAYQIGYHRPTRWGPLPKAARVERGDSFLFQAIPDNIIQKIHLDKKDSLEILSDEEEEFETKFAGFGVFQEGKK
jgi:hypothetical protein